MAAWGTRGGSLGHTGWQLGTHGVAAWGTRGGLGQLGPTGWQSRLRGVEGRRLGDLDVGLDLGDVVSPHAVDLLEERALLGHLAHDVFRAKDGLEVLPHALHLEPEVDQVLGIIRS